MGKIIAVINDKGGVSKTTTVMNLGTALWLYGKKVLLIDNDHQCNLTYTLDKTAMEQDCNLYSWIKDKESQIPVFERYDGLDYIPSSPMLERLETELNGRAGYDLQLKMRLNALMKKYAYDYILIDCGPGCSSIVNLNAMQASDELIVPIRSDLYSVAGRGLLHNKIMEIRELGHELKVAGILLTQYDKKTEMGRSVKEHFKNIKQGDVEMPLFPTEIRRCEDVNKAPAKQMSVYEYNADANAADDYMRIAEYMMGVNPRKKTWTTLTWREKATKAYNDFITNQQN